MRRRRHRGGHDLDVRRDLPVAAGEPDRPNTFNVTYAYDPAGNRLTQTDSGAQTTYGYDAANELLTESGPSGRTTYSYDACGNRTQKDSPASGLTFYTWDENNRMTQAVPVAGPVTLTYNAAGQRVAKATAAETRQFLYDFDKVLQESEGGATVREYTSTDEQYGNLVSVFDHGQSLFFEYDCAGVHRCPGQQQPVCHRPLLVPRLRAGDPHRDGRRQPGANLANPLAMDLGTVSGPTSPGTDHTFVGQLGYVSDPEIDLYFVCARYYDYATGRFVNEDPIGYQAGMPTFTATWAIIRSTEWIQRERIADHRVPSRLVERLRLWADILRP